MGQEPAEAIRKDVEARARKAGYIARKGLRKEDRIKRILAPRGRAPGIPGVEACASTRRPAGKSFLRSRRGKGLYSYVHFIDPDWGRCCLRICTWAPFRIPFYGNG